MKDRLIELIKASVYGNIDEGFDGPELNSENVADHLLANGAIVLPCQKGTVLNRNGEKCIANHWSIILTAFNEDNHVRLFDVKEVEEKLRELNKNA